MYNEEILEKCLPSSINSAWVDGDITEEQCDYLYKKYVRMEK